MQAVLRLTERKIPQCIMPAISGPRKISLHVFGDAIKAAYCTAVYLVWQHENQSGAHLVSTKTRLPLIRKEMTIPRLEPTAARIAARFWNMVRETLKTWKPEELVLWSDSRGITRAIHLELTVDMTANEFRGTFQGFISIRGAPAAVISDNAKTFLATAKPLKKICVEQELQDLLLANRIDLHFNVAKAPWQGGFFERFVQDHGKCEIKLQRAGKHVDRS